MHCFPKSIVATGLVLLAMFAQADDRRVEGVVKAVDAEKRTLTLETAAGPGKDAALDVAKKAKITVNGKAATLGDLRRGQKAAAVVDGELDVVKALDATGEGVAPMVPEVAVVNELPEPGSWRGCPWPSADGLTLYWYSKPLAAGADAFWIWSARRKTKDDLFADAKKLVPGMDMTVSADGLEMVLLQDQALHVATRPTTDAPFTRPRKLNEFKLPGGAKGHYTRPCFSGDGLTLYVDEARPDQFPVPMKFTRGDRGAPWRGPSPVQIALPARKRAAFLSVTPDGSRAFCMLREPGPAAGPAELATMRAEGAGFARPEVIRIGGAPLDGTFARYVPATNELFYVAAAAPGRPSEIRLVRNFDPDAIGAAPAGSAAAAAPARSDRDLLQGAWVSVSEVNGGSPLTAEQLRSMDKRMEVRGDRIVVRRTGLGGKFAVFEGAFRLDPTSEPKTFDWSAKGPDGAFEMRGIYVLDGDTFRLCHGPVRPTELSSNAGSRRQLIVYKRERK